MDTTQLKRSSQNLIFKNRSFLDGNGSMQANMNMAVQYASVHDSTVFPKRKQKTGVWATNRAWQGKLRREGIRWRLGNVGVVCSTVCAAVNDWAAWKISGSRSRCKAWLHCGCGCAGPGSWSWRMTWRSEDTCEVWPLCATWSGSACQTYWRRSPHTSGTYRRRDTEMGGRDGGTKRKEDTRHGRGDSTKWEKMG